MTIKEIKEKLKTSTNPVVKSLHQGANFKILLIGFNKGMLLKKHQTTIKTKLTVLEGSVVYQEENKKIELGQYNELEIPVEVIHSVEASEDSLCILTQGE